MGEHIPLDQSDIVGKASTQPPQSFLVPGQQVGRAETRQIIKAAEAYLTETGNFANYETVNIDYAQLDANGLNGQIALSIILIQPVMGSLVSGTLNPGTKIVMTTQQEGRYAAGEKAFPMGKIDVAKDLADTSADENQTEGLTDDEKTGFVNNILGSPASRTIINAAIRERSEEIGKTPSQSEAMLAGSFIDKQTGLTIHVVVENVVATTEDNTVPFSVSLSEDQKREHAKVEIIDIANLQGAEPISDGAKFSILTALKAIEKTS